jgi:putative component of membrane protein insertase Oxa1/YidC/SpoIIIJ protein YidD
VINISINRLFSFLILVVFYSIAYSQEEYIDISSWEPDDLIPIYSSFDSTHNFVIKPSILFANTLIGFYQKKISTQSISRCPFYISCSNYAYMSIQKYSFLFGICFFIDRYFYRENIACYYYYEFRENEYGILKLDDSFFIFGKDKQ